MKRWGPIAGALIGGAIAAVIAWSLAGADVGHAGDWRSGALRFIGLVTALGLVIGYVGVARLTRGAHVSRDGFTLSYRALAPIAAGYRELTSLTIADLGDRLRATGYTPAIEHCDALGQRTAAADPTTPLEAANIAVTDPAVRGWIRLQLLPPVPGQPRARALLEIWSERGASAEQLALFTLRELGVLVGDLTASRESSQLGEDPVALVTAGLPDRRAGRT